MLKSLFLCSVCTLLSFPLAANAQGVITTVAGSTWIFRAGGQATSAPLGNIAGVASDPAGNVYAADSSNDLVVRIAPDGTLTVVAGNGISGFSGDNGFGSGASLFFPSAVAVDAAGNVYIADTLNQRVRKVSGKIITTLAGTGNAGFTGEGGPAASARLNSPGGLAVDSTGNVYVADTLNDRVRRIAPDGTITTVAGAGLRGFSGDNGPATRAALNTPRGLAVDKAGNLLIADWGNHRIRQVSAAGTITTLAGTGSQGFSGDNGPATAATLNFPYSVAVDVAGAVYIADSVNQRIRKVAGGIIYPVAGNGTRALAGDGGPASSASFNQPQGVAIDAYGNVFVGDTFNNRVRKAALGGKVSTVAGSGFYKFSGDGGAAIGASLNGPQGLAADSAGRFYLADLRNHRVRRVNAAGVIATVAGNGTQGYSGDNGPAAAAALNSPAAVALDAIGNIYVADTGNNRVRKIDANGTITALAGAGVAGYSGDGGPANIATLNRPGGVAADTAGNVYISDTGNHAIRKVSAAGVISTLAGNGVPGSSGDNGPAAVALLNSPGGLAVDSAGNLYVADTANHRVRRITSGGTISTVAGNGTAGDTGDGGAATAASLNTPGAVALDSNGALLIADTFNHRVRRVAGGVISALAGSGTAGFAGDGGPATAAALNQPLGVAVDSLGNILIADTLNDRVREVFATTPSFSVSPTSLSFSVAAGTPAVGARLVDVSSSATGLAWIAAATTESGGAWLVVSPNSGAVPASIAVSVNVAGLAPGKYRGSVLVAASAAMPPFLSVFVDLTVDAASAPTLTVEPAELTIEAPAGSNAPISRSIRVSNSGGGTLNWTAEWHSLQAVQWLSISPASGTASAGNPAPLQINVAPGSLPAGVYTGTVRVSASGTGFQPVSSDVPVTLLVAQPAQTILLSQTGLLFTGVEGGTTIPAQSFGILNTGQGLMNWTVETSTLTGGSWLGVTPASGSTQADAMEIPMVDVSASPGSLRTGRYSGLVRVRAQAANNSPQLVTVDMNVLPAGANPGVLVRPTGLIFVAREGASSPGSQTMRLATAGTRAVGVRGGVFTFDGASWLEARPRNLTLLPGESATVTVQPTLGSLTRGEYRGSLTLLFDDGSPSQVVNVLFVVAPGSAVPGSAGVPARMIENIPLPWVAGGDARAPSDAVTCAPKKLYAMLRTTVGGFSSPAGWPTPIEVQVVDDCGSSVPNATVVAAFSTGEPVLVLTSLRNGIYTGTWRPVKPAADITITVRAELSPLTAAEIRARGGVPENARAPALYSGGIVHAASFAPASPLAPGSIVSVFGRNLATGALGAANLPLPTSLAGATLTIAGMDVPLFYSSDGQINAQLPFELAPNTRYQAVVKISDAITVPETITVAAARPGIFTTSQDGKGQGVIMDVNNRLVDSANPAKAGDVVVVYCTGLGATNPAVRSGEPAPAPPSPLARAVTPVTVTIGGQPATVQFAGLTPGLVGLYQVNVQIPSGITPGASVPLVITQDGVPSNTVTLGIR
jgi:uncharacterized protein (TIGR03437 family)